MESLEENTSFFVLAILSWWDVNLGLFGGGVGIGSGVCKSGRSGRGRRRGEIIVRIRSIYDSQTSQCLT